MLVTLDDVLILFVNQSKAISELTHENEGYSHSDNEYIIMTALWLSQDIFQPVCLKVDSFGSDEKKTEKKDLIFT